MVQAKYAYKAAQPDELTFEENALIEVLNHEEEGWWRGRLTASGVEGLFPVNYVQPYTNALSDGVSASPTAAAASSSAPKPSAVIMARTLAFKRNWREHLLFCNQIFYDELERRNVGTAVLSEIFGRWPSLVLLSQAFYKELNERRPQLVSGESEIIGDIMFSHLPRCFIYRDFCATQDAGLLRLKKLCEEQPALGKLIKDCERRTRAGVLPLASYFIKPVQRISKYKLMLEKILKYTSDSHPDLKNLQQSFQLASVVLDACNEAVRNRENVEQLFLLQERVIFTTAVPEITFFDQIAYLGSRSLMLSGKLFKVKSGKELIVFLFNDMLFLTVLHNSKEPITLPLRSSPKLRAKLKVYREPFYYNDVSLGSPRPEIMSTLWTLCPTSFQRFVFCFPRMAWKAKSRYLEIRSLHTTHTD
ncbi:unnamed protein product [Dibothriocephalus latus]|uniref:SH3 domain-containing protein n=1 Tax=Dibothriocephalus latus TaxID=60516 RepID=A0A3P7L986_DIBLA|nr:unnamed protein product [Dibothriocephalus latus]